MIDVTTSYLVDAVHRFDDVFEAATEALQDVDFDTIVGTGMSGAIVVPRLADLLNVSWVLVRRKNESNHADGMLEGVMGNRWLFVDDLIASGDTLQRVHEAINEEFAGKDWPLEFAGSWVYSESWGRHFYDPGDAPGEKRSRDRVKAALQGAAQLNSDYTVDRMLW